MGLFVLCRNWLACVVLNQRNCLTEVIAGIGENLAASRDNWPPASMPILRCFNSSIQAQFMVLVQYTSDLVILFACSGLVGQNDMSRKINRPALPGTILQCQIEVPVISLCWDYQCELPSSVFHKQWKGYNIPVRAEFRFINEFI